MLRPRLILMLATSIFGDAVSMGQIGISLINGTSRCCGRVEINHNGQWGTVCDDNWNMNDAEVVCRQMGCGRALSAPQSARFGQGNSPILLDNVTCSGSESSITACLHHRFGSHNCSHGGAAGVICSNVLQSPTFTQISSHTAVLPGEALQFRCTSLNPTCISANFSLYKNGESVKTQTAESSTTFRLTVDSSDQGQYSCGYSYKESSSITSPRSSSININVVNLLQPNISFRAPDGPSHWWLQGPEVTRGYSFSIICSTEQQFPGGSFYLESSGSISRTQSAINHLATFLFHEADLVHHGIYSCVYEVVVSSRTFNSPTSELLAVSVKASPIPIIGSGVAAGLLLLILVPIIIFFIMRRKKLKYQVVVKKDQTHDIKNTYGSDRGKNEMEDEDYENAETILQQREDSDDSGEDYVNVIADAENSGAKMTCTNTGNETDDDDYENVDVTDNQGEDSDYLDIDAEETSVDNDYEEEQVYESV